MKKIISLFAISLILSTHFVSAQGTEKQKSAKTNASEAELKRQGYTDTHPKVRALQAADAADPWQRKLKELRYEGLPLGEVARHLGGQFPEINFVVAPDDTEARVNVDLRSVALEDVFAAMNLASKGTIQADKINDRMVHFKLVESPPSQPAPKRQCAAFSLNRYLSGRSDKEMDEAIEDIYKTLEQCWKMLAKANPTDSSFQSPDFSLHRKTKLLLVVGVPEQLEVVGQVVNQLQGNEAAAPGAIDPATGLPLPVGYGNPYAPGLTGAATSSSSQVTKIFQLKHADANNTATAITATFKGDSLNKVFPDGRTSQIIVTATEQKLAEVEKLLKQLDVPSKQGEDRRAGASSSSTNNPPSNR